MYFNKEPYFSKIQYSMRAIYTFFTHLSYPILWGISFFNPKMKQFMMGRKIVFSELQNAVSKDDDTIWFHCASLGEYEQGLPVMEEVRKAFSRHKIVLTFFSPSGYEIRKNTTVADIVTYLPLDTLKNSKKFLDIVNPAFAVFVKYEFWPNYLLSLKKRKVPTLLISALFRENQALFKSHGKWIKKALFAFDWIFVQDYASKELLERNGFTRISISGDTRFDRVSHQIEQDNSLDFMDAFIDTETCIVCGSTWPEDDDILIDYINTASKSVKFVIAPHNMKVQQIEGFRNKLSVSSVLYSEKENKSLNDFSVFIIDTIGYLTKIFSYADIAYVGGAMGRTGLHNILEPATFGIPIVIGKEFEKFPEAEKLQKMAGLFSVENKESLKKIFDKLINDTSFREKTGMIAGHYINSNTGATAIITEYIKSNYSNS